MSESTPPPRSRLPWIVGGLVALLIVGGLGLYFYLDDEATPGATSTSGQTTGTPDGSETSAAEESPGESTQSTADGTDSNGTPLAFEGSPDQAAAFLDTFIAQDYEGAYALLTEDLRGRYPDALAFADEFLAEVGVSEIISKQLATVFGGTDHDEVNFLLETDAGPAPVSIAVTEEAGELLVCLFAVPQAGESTGISLECFRGTG